MRLLEFTAEAALYQRQTAYLTGLAFTHDDGRHVVAQRQKKVVCVNLTPKECKALYNIDAPFGCGVCFRI